MTSASSLLSVRSRARNEGNLRLTRPRSRDLQVFGVVGRGDDQIDHVARRAGGELRVSCDSAQETSRGVKADPRTGPRRRVPVPSPEEKQGVQADRDDDVRADGVARPAGGEEHVAAEGHASHLPPCSRGYSTPTAPAWLLVSELSSSRGAGEAAALVLAPVGISASVGADQAHRPRECCIAGPDRQSRRCCSVWHLAFKLDSATPDAAGCRILGWMQQSGRIDETDDPRPIQQRRGRRRWCLLPTRATARGACKSPRIGRRASTSATPATAAKEGRRRSRTAERADMRTFGEEEV